MTMFMAKGFGQLKENQKEFGDSNNETKVKQLMFEKINHLLIYVVKDR